MAPNSVTCPNLDVCGHRLVVLDADFVGYASAKVIVGECRVLNLSALVR
jgi:hypothetical protein